MLKYKAVSRKRSFLQDFIQNTEYFLSDSSYVPDLKKTSKHWILIRIEIFESELFMRLFNDNI